MILRYGTLLSAISSYATDYTSATLNGASTSQPQEALDRILDWSNKMVESSNSSLSAIGAGVAMVGAVGVGVGQGIAVGRGLEAMARNPELFKKLQTSLIIGLAIVESSSIYSFIIALILSFK